MRVVCGHISQRILGAVRPSHEGTTSRSASPNGYQCTYSDTSGDVGYGQRLARDCNRQHKWAQGSVLRMGHRRVCSGSMALARTYICVPTLLNRSHSPSTSTPSGRQNYVPSNRRIATSSAGNFSLRESIAGVDLIWVYRFSGLA